MKHHTGYGNLKYDLLPLFARNTMETFVVTISASVSIKLILKSGESKNHFLKTIWAPNS